MAYDAFLWFPGSSPAIDGETTDDEMKPNKAIEIQAFSFGASNYVNIGSQSGGAGAGKADFSAVSVMKATDKATMELFANLCTGTHIPDAVIALRRSGVQGKSGSIFLQFSFKLVYVSSINWSGGSGNEICNESVSLDYGSIKIEYFAQGTDGKNTKAGEKMWSRIKNTAAFVVA